MASVFQTAVTQALYKQPWYIRRKDSIAATAGLVLQVLNVVAGYSSDLPEEANVVIAAGIGLCQIFIHARMKGPITPSQAERLEAAAYEATLDREPESGYAVAPEETPPVVEAQEYPPSAFEEGRNANATEGREHRAH